MKKACQIGRVGIGDVALTRKAVLYLLSTFVILCQHITGIDAFSLFNCMIKNRISEEMIACLPWLKTYYTARGDTGKYPPFLSLFSCKLFVLIILLYPPGTVSEGTTNVNVAIRRSG